MKKFQSLLIFFILPTIIIFLLLLNIFLPGKKYKDFSQTNYQLSGKNYKFLIADTPAKWEKGIMYFKKLEEVSGMIFLFPDKNYRNFWNKNTYLDLNLYWINDNEVVGTSFLPSIEKTKNVTTVTSPQPVNKVIEMVVNSQ